jgi:hypothetical protein
MISLAYSFLVRRSLRHPIAFDLTLKSEGNGMRGFPLGSGYTDSSCCADLFVPRYLRKVRSRNRGHRFMPTFSRAIFLSHPRAAGHGGEYAFLPTGEWGNRMKMQCSTRARTSRRTRCAQLLASFRVPQCRAKPRDFNQKAKRTFVRQQYLVSLALRFNPSSP